ncbi:MAG: dihydroorotase family protein [Nitrospinota bacterium]
MPVDLNVINGRLVIPEVGCLEGGLSVSGGRIVALGRREDLPASRRTLDAQGRHILPGLIDPHIHLGIFIDFASECESESRAALQGGVTTVGCHLARPVSYLEAYPEIKSTAERRLVADLMIHLILNQEQHLREVERYARELEVTSFKMYMCGIPGVIPHVDDAFLLEGFRRAKKAGPRCLACVHAENADLVEQETLRFNEETPDGTLVAWSDTRPNFAEEEAVRRAVYFAQLSGTRLYIVHLSTAEAARALVELRPSRKQVAVETITPYLSITKHEDLGRLGKMVPPFRDQADIDALWEAVADDRIDVIGTDHIAVRKAQKAGAPMADAIPAAPCLETHLPTLLTEGFHRRGIRLEQLVSKVTKRPAEIFGIYPQKGTLAVGSDADFVLVDLEAELTVEADRLASASGFSLLEGRKLKGWPSLTVKGGEVVMEDLEVTADPGIGRVLSRSKDGKEGVWAITPAGQAERRRRKRA